MNYLFKFKVVYKDKITQQEIFEYIDAKTSYFAHLEASKKVEVFNTGTPYHLWTIKSVRLAA